ncbi:MAG: type II toxin-antitoxin system VapC family toxin [Gammaproteobacteria bacterium]|nr:type II toxin-antitoxin system VapC family toxin [Gammaproteobacteria bacterium]
MIAVDTNVIVRLITADDIKQAEKAKILFGKHSIFITKTVLLETEWVLRAAYKTQKKKIHQSFLRLLGLPNVEIESQTEIKMALKWYEQGLDFADALHLASSAPANSLITLDKKFSTKANKIQNKPVKLL